METKHPEYIKYSSDGDAGIVFFNQVECISGLNGSELFPLSDQLDVLLKLR